MEQIVREPTRMENALDLIITNRGDNINKVMVIPGIGDHDALFVETTINTTNNHQTRQEVPLYKQADWDGFKDKRPFN